MNFYEGSLGEPQRGPGEDETFLEDEVHNRTEFNGEQKLSFFHEDTVQR